MTEQKILTYKGIKFNEFNKDDLGTWASICEHCQNKYKNVLSDEMDSDGSGGGVCSVKGCTNSDWENENMVVDYIDIDINKATIGSE